MTDFDVLKASGIKNFIQCYDKNFTLTNDKKVTFSAKTSLPFSEYSRVNIKGLFSLFKSSERFISPFLSLEHENYFQINYNLLKNSANMNVNFPKENSLIKSISYQITPDKTNCKLTQNNITFLFKNNFKFSFNHDSNETFLHLTSKMNNIGRFKYKYNNKGKNTFSILINRGIYRTYVNYFHNLELKFPKIYPTKNIFGLVGNVNLSPTFCMNLILGASVGETWNICSGLFTRHNVNSSLKIENCVFIGDIKGKEKRRPGCAFSTSYKNLITYKIKTLKNEIKNYFYFNFKNVSLSVNLNYESTSPNKSPLKYSVNLNFKW